MICIADVEIVVVFDMKLILSIDAVAMIIQQLFVVLQLYFELANMCLSYLCKKQ